MIDLNEILSRGTIAEKIDGLKERSTPPQEWGLLLKDYEPSLHKIVDDHQMRKDKQHADGTVDKAARITIGLEKLLTRRYNEFTFAIPVKRTYSGMETDAQKDIAKLIERIYTVAHIDAENKKRGTAYYASCEALTIWYAKKGKHNLYGFPCNYKLKCKTFSPMDGTSLWPLIDEFGEMYAMSFEYRRKVKDEWVTFFETYTAENHYVWKKGENADWETVVNGDEIKLNKIPAIYIYRPKPVWDGLKVLREDLEYTLSRNSDTIAYNSAPILKVAGGIQGEEQKGETRRVYRVMEGGDVSYVSWAQSIAALEYHASTLINLYFMQAQMPDISFTNMSKLGSIGFDARKLLFSDAHLRIGDESGAWIEFLERENSVVKAFAKEVSKIKGYNEDDFDAIMIENTITPYIQEDDVRNIEKWMKASGDTPLISPLEAIENAGLSNDPQKTFAEILSYQIAMEAAKNPQPEQAQGGEGNE